MSNQIFLKRQNYIAITEFSYYKMEIIDTVTAYRNEKETAWNSLNVTYESKHFTGAPSFVM